MPIGGQLYFDYLFSWEQVKVAERYWVGKVFALELNNLDIIPSTEYIPQSNPGEIHEHRYMNEPWTSLAVPTSIHPQNTHKNKADQKKYEKKLIILAQTIKPQCDVKSPISEKAWTCSRKSVRKNKKPKVYEVRPLEHSRLLVNTILMTIWTINTFKMVSSGWLPASQLWFLIPFFFFFLLQHSCSPCYFFHSY